MTDVTRILDAIERGEATATEELLPLVYEELRVLAAQKLSGEKPGQTLQTTALVHEAYLRLVGDGAQHWSGRAHFFGAAEVACCYARSRLLCSNRHLSILGHIQCSFPETVSPNGAFKETPGRTVKPTYGFIE